MTHSLEIDHIYSAPGPPKSSFYPKKKKKKKGGELKWLKENEMKSPLHLKAELNKSE